MSSYRTVTVHLKGDWAPSGENWDRGIVRKETDADISIQDDIMGGNLRSYPKANIARIDEMDR